MSYVRLRQFLVNVARQYQRERETFSRQEIVAKINEIKYLSAQKKIPRITLRKEILHLENKLKGVMEMEQQVLRQKQQESAKVKTLKHQIAVLKERLAATGDKDLHKKVERLTHLLGEHAAKKNVRDEVALSRSVMVEQKAFSLPTMPDSERLNRLEQRLNLLKQEVEIQKHQGNSTDAIEQKITLLEQKLQEYSSKEPAQIKHTILFESPPATAVMPDLESDIEKELPLPPPPRMRKRF